MFSTKSKQKTEPNQTSPTVRLTNQPSAHVASPSLRLMPVQLTGKDGAESKESGDGSDKELTDETHKALVALATEGDNQDMSLPQALALLGLSESANEKEIRRQYRVLARLVHPDHGLFTDTGPFVRLHSAYQRALGLTQSMQPQRPLPLPAPPSTGGEPGGIEHLQNSCYIASILTLLSRIPQYRDLFDPTANILPEHSPGRRLQQAVAPLLSAVHSGRLVEGAGVARLRQALLDLGLLVGDVNDQSPVMEQQQDAGEVMMKMLDLVVHQDNRATFATHTRTTRNYDDPLQQANPEINHQPVLQIGVEQRLEDALASYFGSHRHGGAEVNNPYTETVHGMSFPEVLTLYVVRRGDQPMDMPAEFTMPAEFSDSGAPGPRYRLQGFILHNNYGGKGGHYVSYVPDDDGQWYLSDDMGGGPHKGKEPEVLGDPRVSEVDITRATYGGSKRQAFTTGCIYTYVKVRDGENGEGRVGLGPVRDQPREPRIHQVINRTTGRWEYFFPDKYDLPDSKGRFHNDGYRYKLLRQADGGFYYERERSDGSGSIQRDLTNELLLHDLFQGLVDTFGPNLGVRDSDRITVASIIHSPKTKSRQAKADRILQFFQGLFLSAYSQAQEAGEQEKIQQDWSRFCKYLEEINDTLDGKIQFNPVQELAKADPSHLNAYHAEKAASVAPPYGVKVEGEDENALVHRSEADIEIIDGVAYVRIYQTVYAPSLDGKFKDIRQLESGKVIIESVGEKAWLNMGWPVRAFHYVKTYSAQGVTKRKEAMDKLDKKSQTYQAEKQKVELLHGLPIIRTFLVPKDFHDEYTMGAISESQVEQLGSNHTLNVDKARAPNQYGVRARDVKLFEEKAVPHSLVSFVDDKEIHRYNDPQHGTVKGRSELAKWLAMPEEENPFIPPLKGTHVDQPHVQKERADELSALYDLTVRIEDALTKDEPNAQSLIDWWDALALKYGVSFPQDPKAIPALKDALERAASFSLVPHLIQENYEEFRERMRNRGVRDRTGERLELWTELQQIPMVSYPSVRDDEVVPTKVKRSDAEGRVGETVNPIIDLLIDYFNDKSRNLQDYVQEQSQITQVVEFMLAAMTREKLCGEDARNPETLALLKEVVYERVRARVKRTPDLTQRKDLPKNLLQVLQLGFELPEAMIMRLFKESLHTASVPSDTKQQEATVLQRVKQRYTEIQTALLEQVKLLNQALLSAPSGGEVKELQGALDKLSAYLSNGAEPTTTPDAIAFQHKLTGLHDLLRSQPQERWDSRSMRKWCKRATASILEAVEPQEESGTVGSSQGSTSKNAQSKAPAKSGGATKPSTPKPFLEPVFKPAEQVDLLKDDKTVARELFDQARLFMHDLSPGLRLGFVKGFEHLLQSKRLAELYRNWLGRRAPAKDLQAAFLQELLDGLVLLYRQFKELQADRAGAQKGRPFSGQVQVVDPNWSPFTGVYDRSAEALRNNKKQK